MCRILTFSGMAGFLDPKQRFLDTILTLEGRRAIANGRLAPRFFSFSDATVFYREDTVPDGQSSTEYRPQLENVNLRQDKISFESDVSGKLVSRELADSLVGLVVGQGQILTEVSGVQEALRGRALFSGSVELLDSSLRHFKKCRILGSPEALDDRRKRFQIAPQRTEPFIVTDDRPIDHTGTKSAKLEQIESFFQDRKLAHIPNFQFLPPINKRRLGEDTASPLGTYEKIEQAPILEFRELSEELDRLEEQGFLREFSFPETSKLNRIFGQFFEIGTDTIKKLDVIDFGVFPTEEGMKQVFFVGKIFTDDYRCDTFVNIFTMVFE